jgi:glycosyltransferase involved in cell wall biosynthesis
MSPFDNLAPGGETGATVTTGVTAIVPARNEELNIEKCVRALDAQPEIEEIIVVNDGSSDNTGIILKELVPQLRNLRPIEIQSVPDGWTGKNYAVSVGAGEAASEWLLFVDADTELEPWAVRRALEDARKNAAEMVSYSPEQELGTLSERVLVPFVYYRLARHFSFERVNDPQFADAAANGQFILIRRSVYESSGGHDAVKARVLEDVALARLVKAAGHHIFFGPGQGIARTRMYRRFGEMWAGWTKNLYELIGGTFGAMALELAETFPWVEILLVALGAVAWGTVRAVAWGAWGAAVAVLVARHIQYGAALRRNHIGDGVIQYYLPASVLYGAALVGSWGKRMRGWVTWKERRYRTE